MNGAGTYVRAANYGSDAGFVNAGSSLTAASHNQVLSSITQARLQPQSTRLNSMAPERWISPWEARYVLTLANGGILRAGGGSTTISSGTLRSNAGTELVFRTDTVNDSLTINSNIASNGGGYALTKSGAGTVTLTGSTTYLGQTYVNGGVLSISSNANLGAQTTGAALNLSNGTLRTTSSLGLYNGSAGINDRNVVLANIGTFEVVGSSTLTVSGVVSDNFTLTSNSQIRRGTLNKTGTGVLVLTNNNTYNGDTTVSAGTLILSGTLTNTRSISVASTATLTVNGLTNSAALSVAGTLNGNGTIGGPATITGALRPETPKVC